MKKNNEENLIGIRLEPAALVAYQPGAIVSRTVINKKVGTVTLFAFDRGQSLSEHTSPYDAMVQVVDGEGEFLVGKKPHTLRSGEMMIMPAQIPHAVRAVEKFKMMLVMIRA